LSASQDFPPAIYQIGVCYDGGYGVELNKEKAQEYFDRATKLGFEGE